MSVAGQPYREPGWPSPAETPEEADELAAQGRARALAIANEGVAHATGTPVDDGDIQVVNYFSALLRYHAKSGHLVACDHLAHATTSPMFWLPSLPTRPMCRLCLPAAQVPSQCDFCAADAPLKLRRWVLTIDPITCVGFLCTDCEGELPATWRAP